MSYPLSVAPRQATPVVMPHTAYQVDFMSRNCGKIVPASKRRICFKFGYTNAAAFADGKTGHDCRGSEHEIVITWSISSGKQAISYDQQDIFYDVCDSTQSKLSHTWEDKFGRCLQLKIHAASMSTKTNPDPNWKQYDLLVDGVSFFLMPKIFEIGVFSREDATASLALGPNFDQCSSGDLSSAQLGRFGNIPKDNMDILPSEQPKAPELVDLLSFDEFNPPAPVVAPYTHAVPVQIGYAPAQVATQIYHDPAQVPQEFTPPGSENKYCLAQDPSTFYPNASRPRAVTSENNPTPVTPPASSSALAYPLSFAPVSPQQGMTCDGFAQTLDQRQYNSYCVQQINTNPGFNYQ